MCKRGNWRERWYFRAEVGHLSVQIKQLSLRYNMNRFKKEIDKVCILRAATKEPKTYIRHR